MEAKEIIERLELLPHLEGGYFRRTYQADDKPMVETEHGKRYSMTSIYYLLAEDSPIGHWHRNRSDILHFFQLGNPVRYHLLYDDGTYETVVLGSSLEKGQRLQFLVKGGVWKASELLDGPGNFGLISEAVTPGFDPRDMKFGNLDELSAAYPAQGDMLHRFIRK